MSGEWLSHAISRRETTNVSQAGTLLGELQLDIQSPTMVRALARASAVSAARISRSQPKPIRASDHALDGEGAEKGECPPVETILPAKAK
jgi:hypothetical protein